MPLLDQETQIQNSDVYDDTIAAGVALESPAAADQNIRFDLNAIRSQLRRIIDPQGLAGTADWFVDIVAALNGFGLRQIHDKPFVYPAPFNTNNAFSLPGAVDVVAVSSAMVAGAAGIIAVGPSSSQTNAYVAASEANFVAAGTPVAGTSQATSGAGVLLNRVAIFLDGTNDPPLDGGTEVFGLLQSQSGVADSTSIAGAASENLQISFVKIDPVTDVITAVTLPIGDYQFQLPYQQNFNDLDRGAFMGGGLPDVIDPSSTVARRPFRQFNVAIPGGAAAGDPLNVQTGVFSTAGATVVFASFGTPVLPASANEFRDDERCVIVRNGNVQTKGPGEDVQWVSPTQLSFSKAVKNNDKITITSLASFA